MGPGVPRKAHRRSIRTLVIVLAALGLWSVVVPEPARVSPSLDRVVRALIAQPGDEAVRVIVQARPGHFAGLREDLLADPDTSVGCAVPDAGLICAVVRPVDLAALAGDRRVAGLSSDAPIRSSQDPKPAKEKGSKDAQLSQNHLLQTLGLVD